MSDPVIRALAEVAELGPFFAIATDPAEEADPTWRRLDALDADDLAGLITAYARRLGGVGDRVAASVLFQGLASRLWSPVVACAAGYGIVPGLAGLHWRWTPGAPIALWLADPAAVATTEPTAPPTAPPTAGATSEPAAAPTAKPTANPTAKPTAKPTALPAAVHSAVVEGGLRPLRETFGAVVKLADGLVWGNAASALAGTLRAGSLRPELAGPLSGLVGALLAMEPLAGTGAFAGAPSGGTLRPEAFRRRSCCLYYRVPPGGGMCGDCALLPGAEAAGAS